ncbi:alpha-mannosidase [Salinactinospora qingdaonensis]|uniref:Glycoside hydrolase family 38 C-terminal domain-containing protein n=1 Tax=Salinactinospora qingdaonensis TaxID=702744 RepID=A0ABP7FVH7_9ACTN
MHDDRLLVEQRLDRVLGQRIWTAIYPTSIPLTIERWDVAGEPVPVETALAAPYRPARVGEPWGPPWATTWLRLSGTVPPQWAGCTVEAVIDLGFAPERPGFCAEGLAHRPDGTVIKGLNPRNQWLPVADTARGGEEFQCYIEAAANPLILGPDGFTPTALGDDRTAGEHPLYTLRRLDLAIFDRTVWHLAMDLEVLGGVMAELAPDTPRRWEILRAVERCLDRLDLADVAGSAEAARGELAEVLAAPAHASAHRVSAVGHAHIDSAWLWPLRETVRKVARTTANVTSLMDDDPTLVFAMSQAQQLAWLRDHRPDVYARVRERAAEGRFVPVGGMWVEADTNMPGGEAMARQFSHGRRFFRDEFGVDTPEVWLPDSFGYSAALPQLIRLSGASWFLTQKISWNQHNPFPHHTFWWEGIDGSRVFTHFPPVDTYNCELSPGELGHAQRNFREKGRARWSLVPFGHGDGGGGPTREMLARAERMADLEGAPRVRLERPAEFFARAAAEYPDAPVWEGELYLELHRGTYTSQAATKRGNRRSEHLLREAELWAATATVRIGAPYPYEQLDRLWKRVLLHQFHDILPGTSIAWVHRQAAQTYAEIGAELTEIIDTAQQALAGDATTGQHIEFNAAPHARDGVPALGAAPAFPTEEGEVTVSTTSGGHVLDNGLLRVSVDPRGLVTSVLDLASGREAIAPGAAANLLQLHPDLPNAWDAWDVDSFYRNRVSDLVETEEPVTVLPEGRAAAVTVRRRFGDSTVRQTVTLRPGAHRLDMTADVDWRERESFLKAAFPLDVRAGTAASETQFGHVHRPTHTNTSWDAAKFETCAHRWVRVSEPHYGHALVNAETYGHDVTRDVRDDGGTTTTVRLSLLRAPRFPDPETDQGRHAFSYSLVPGAGIADAIREGYRINLPARRVAGDTPVPPLVTVDAPGVVVESVKLADDRSGDVVVRLYEAHGDRASTEVRAGFDVSDVWTVDLLEDSLAAAAHLRRDGAALHCDLRPFQILTLRFARQRS